MFSKICLLVVVFYWCMFGSETDEAECIDWWPYCYVFNPPCSNHTDNELEVRVWCPKQCGLCPHQEIDKQSADTTCRDKLDCSPYNLIEGCQSNNTWYRQYCRVSCNVCLSDNGTTERRETDDQNSSLRTRNNVYHTSAKDAIGADTTCRDKLDCSPFNLSERCQSNNTWYRQHCRLSCNICLSDNGTTERRETDDQESTPHTGSNISHTSTKDALDNTLATSVTAAIIASGITFTVTLAAVLLCRKQGLCDAHTHERQPDHDQSHSVVQMTANMGIECCPEHNTNIYDEIGNVNDTAYEDQKASTDNSKYKMLIIKNIDGHSDTITYLHPFDDPTYIQSLEDEQPVRMFNTDTEKCAKSGNHEYYNWS